MKHAKIIHTIADNIEQVIVGKRDTVQLILCALLCRGHVLIEDVPGVGKTSMIASLAASLHCSFSRIQFTPDILPSDITGFSIYNPKTGEFEYRQGALMSQIVLADEINRTSPKTQSSLLEAMEENQVTVDGQTYPLPAPFIVLATQNPIEYLGTYALPEAQLDRFFMKLTIGYPTAAEEEVMLRRYQSTKLEDHPMASLEAVAHAEDILALQQLVGDVYCDEKLYGYIVALIAATRSLPEVLLGGSPRATLALLKASQAWALMAGRTYVVPDDIQYVAPYILEHRLLLRQESKMKHISAFSLVQRAIEQTKVPLLRPSGVNYV